MLTVYTVGHSNHDLERFIDLVRRHQIAVIADVRSQPYSRFVQHFSQGPLREALKRNGISYVFMGGTLGGRPADPSCYDDEGHVNYRAVSEAAWFKDGLARLTEGATERRVAILCGEEDPTHCHRRLLVGRILDGRGDEVIHIRGDGSLQSESELSETESIEQLNLFGAEERPWRSVRSVLRDGLPGSSSPD